MLSQHLEMLPISCTVEPVYNEKGDGASCPRRTEGVSAPDTAMEIEYFESGLISIILLFATLLTWVMPELTRRDILFGVTVVPNVRETAAGRAIIRRYRAGIVLIAFLTGVALVLLTVLAPANLWDSILSPILIGGASVLFLLPYLIAHNKSRALRAEGNREAASIAQSNRPAVDVSERRYTDYVSWIWELLPLGIIGATVAYLATQYASAPALIATHFTAAGTVDAYSPKSIGTFFSLVWMQLGMYLLLTLISVLIVKAKAVNGEADYRFRVIWLRVLFVIKTATIGLFSLLAVVIANADNQSHFIAYWLVPVTLGLVVVLLVALFVIAVRIGQGGSRLASGNEMATDQLDDRFWKYGMLYVNPDDPSVFVERRYGIGWTINFGNPGAIAIFIGILAVPIAIAIVTAVLASTH